MKLGLFQHNMETKHQFLQWRTLASLRQKKARPSTSKIKTMMHTVKLCFNTSPSYKGSFIIPWPFPYALSHQLPQLHWCLMYNNFCHTELLVHSLTLFLLRSCHSQSTHQNMTSSMILNAKSPKLDYKTVIIKTWISGYWSRINCNRKR
jgi:hypothetical protein